MQALAEGRARGFPLASISCSSNYLLVCRPWQRAEPGVSPWPAAPAAITICWCVGPGRGQSQGFPPGQHLLQLLLLTALLPQAGIQVKAKYSSLSRQCHNIMRDTRLSQNKKNKTNGFVQPLNFKLLL